MNTEKYIVRLSDKENVSHAVAAWTDWRNDHSKGVDCQFTTDDARRKLKSIYTENGNKLAVFPLSVGSSTTAQ